LAQLVQGTSECLAPGEHGLERVAVLFDPGAARDRDEHVDPVGAARLDVGLELDSLELLADQVRDADRERKAALRRGRGRSLGARERHST
jgi:hypothetical protein